MESKALIHSESAAPRTKATTDVGAVVTSLAAFTIAAFMLVEFAAYWGAGASVGLPSAMAVAAIVGAALTFAFRDRMRIFAAADRVAAE